MDIQQVIEQLEYQRILQPIINRLCFVTFGGSYAYGTNIKSSDIDIRGVVLNSKKDIIGLSNFEQQIDNETDTCIYSFNKLINLLINCNPNVIELLGCNLDTYLFYNNIGIELLKNKKLFLSKKAIGSFGGYATAQLRRLENALAHDNYPNNEKELHILKTINSTLDKLEQYNNIFNNNLQININKQNDNKYYLTINCNIKDYPLRDFGNINSLIQNIVKDFDKLNNRNNKKDNNHLNKHAMHLIRLYLMCFDILEKEEINTYRLNDNQLLLDIRNGKYMKDNGLLNKEFFDIVNECEKRFEFDKNNTSLLDKPNIKKIEEFVMDVNDRIIKDEIIQYDNPIKLL